MKRICKKFLPGVIALALLLSLSVPALAAAGALTITIHPIHILVNGEVFQPKDVNGQDVLCFTVNGTTYAPVRALAEAYGLEVGYDAASNTATVNGSARQSDVSPGDFTSQWEIKEKPVTRNGSEKVFTATYSGNLGMNDFKNWWKSFSAEELAQGAEQLAANARSLDSGSTVTMYFSYGTYNLGAAYDYGGFQRSDFRAANAWIR